MNISARKKMFRLFLAIKNMQIGVPLVTLYVYGVIPITLCRTGKFQPFKKFLTPTLSVESVSSFFSIFCTSKFLLSFKVVVECAQACDYHVSASVQQRRLIRPRKRLGVEKRSRGPRPPLLSGYPQSTNLMIFLSSQFPLAVFLLHVSVNIKTFNLKYF